jgi:anti-sigma factor RsiW
VESLHRHVDGQLPVADPAVVDEDDEPDDEPDDEESGLDEAAGFESEVDVDASFEPDASPPDEPDEEVVDDSLVRLSVR